MAFLNFLSEIAVDMPFAWPWEMLLNGGFTFITDIALRIVFLTVCIKLLLSPLDFYQRYKMRKNQLITQQLQPQLEKLDEQYKNNEKVLQQKKTELNRKSGMSMFASCLPMIATMVIFIWLWASLNNVAQYNQFLDYVKMYEIYDASYSQAVGDDASIDDYAKAYRAEFESKFVIAYDSYDSIPNIEAVRQEARDAAELILTDKVNAYDTLYKVTFEDNFVDTFVRYINNGDVTTAKAADYGSKAGVLRANEVVGLYCQNTAQHEVYNYYFNEGDYKEGGSKADKAYKMQSFFWIKNAWSPDVPWTAPIKASQSEFMTAVGEWATNADKSKIDKATLDSIVSSYDNVTALIHSDEKNNTNGFLILPILALLLNFLTQFITRRQQKSSGQTQATEGQAGCMMKVMMFAMPVMMFFFALGYSAVFALYMVTNSIMSLTINLITTAITKKMVKGNFDVPSKETIAHYGRPDPNAPKQIEKDSKDNSKNNKKR